jgi:hypothetical protein
MSPGRIVAVGTGTADLAVAHAYRKHGGSGEVPLLGEDAGLR